MPELRRTSRPSTRSPSRTSANPSHPSSPRAGKLSELVAVSAHTWRVAYLAAFITFHLAVGALGTSLHRWWHGPQHASWSRLREICYGAARRVLRQAGESIRARTGPGTFPHLRRDWPQHIPRGGIYRPASLVPMPVANVGCRRTLRSGHAKHRCVVNSQRDDRPHPPPSFRPSSRPLITSALIPSRPVRCVPLAPSRPPPSLRCFGPLPLSVGFVSSGVCTTTCFVGRRRIL